MGSRDANLPWGNDAGTIGSDQSALILVLELLDHLDHVVLGNALSDAHNQGDLGVNGLNDGGGGAGRGHVNHGAMGIDGGSGLVVNVALLT